jgi:hypothetical protein
MGLGFLTSLPSAGDQKLNACEVIFSFQYVNHGLKRTSFKS